VSLILKKLNINLYDYREIEYLFKQDLRAKNHKNSRNDQTTKTETSNYSEYVNSWSLSIIDTRDHCRENNVSGENLPNKSVNI